MTNHVDRTRSYRNARRRASQALWSTESARSAQAAAESEAAAAYEAIVVVAEASTDPVIRGAAASVRAQQAALRGEGKALAQSLSALIDRLVSVEAGAMSFGQSAETLVLIAIEGRGGLVERHLAVMRAEAALDDVLAALSEANAAVAAPTPTR